MDLNEFIKVFSAEFEETPSNVFNADTNFKGLDEWNSLTSLSIIAMVDEYFNKRISGTELQSCTTIKELYDLIITK